MNFVSFVLLKLIIIIMRIGPNLTRPQHWVASAPAPKVKLITNSLISAAWLRVHAMTLGMER